VYVSCHLNNFGIIPAFLKDFPPETNVVSRQRIHKELRTVGDLPGEHHMMVLKVITLNYSLTDKKQLLLLTL